MATTEPKKPKYTFDFASEQLIDADAVKSEMAGTVVPIIFRYDSTRSINMGTAFCIGHFTSGQALYVTARHVVEELESAQNIEPMLLLPSKDVEQQDKHLSGVFIEMISISPSYSDVAIIMIDPKNSQLDTLNLIKNLKIMKSPLWWGTNINGLQPPLPALALEPVTITRLMPFKDTGTRADWRIAPLLAQ